MLVDINVNVLIGELPPTSADKSGGLLYPLTSHYKSTDDQYAS